MATRHQLEQQINRCDDEILNTIRTKLYAELMHDSDKFQRMQVRLHALKVLESQLHAAWRRTPR